jgi:hypothetical protein
MLQLPNIDEVNENDLLKTIFAELQTKMDTKTQIKIFA